MSRATAAALLLVAAACGDTDQLVQPPTSTLYTTPTGLVTANPPQIFIGAGDISSCGNNGDEATAQILDTIPGTVYLLGDNVYENGTTSEFNNCYHPTWGRHKARSKPSAGNHEYNTSGASGYYQYFGAAAGDPSKGYYSYDLGAWHIIVLNSNITKSAGSAQDVWLQGVLAAHPNQCTAAYFHHPLYSSDGGTGSGGTTYSTMRALYNTLYAGGIDVVLAGHRHFYERLGPMKPDGTSDPVNGFRTFIVGSGGIGGGSVTNRHALSEAANGDTRGVLKMYLYEDSYAWRFIPQAGKTFTDSSSAACNGTPSGGGGSGVSTSLSTVGASPTSIVASSGGSTSLITVTARDGSGNPVSGASVVLTSTGSGNTLSQPASVTDANGSATGALSSTVAETKTISATAGGVASAQTVTVTVTADPAAPLALERRVAGGTDDAEESASGSVSLSSSDLELVNDGSDQTVGMRFTAVTIPAGATISNAFVQFQADETGLAAVSLTIRGQATGNAATFTTTTGNVSSRSLTASVVSWTPAAWTTVGQAGTVQRTPNLAAIIHEIVNGPGWSSGNALAIIVKGTGKRTAEAYDGLAAAAPLLHVDYTTGGGGPTVSATQSGVSASPGTITASTGASASTVTVTARDASGNPVSGATVQISATGAGNTVTQPAGPTNASGVATGTLWSAVAGPKTVSATANGVAITQTAAVTVMPGAPAALAFVVQPSNVVAGSTITPAVQVGIRDALGNLVTGATNTVTLAIGTNPGGGTLGGTLSVAAVNGLATFSTLSINNVGTGYTLTAAATGLTGATSSGFNVTGVPPSASLSTVAAVPSTIEAGGAGTTITVTAKDASGNAISGATVVLAATGTGNVLTQPVGPTGVSGVATGTLTSTLAGLKTVSATIDGVPITQTAAVTVTAGVPSAATSTVAASPTSITVGTGSSTITVTVKDAFGNPVNGETVELAATGSGNTLVQPTALTNPSGVATGALQSTLAETKTVSASVGSTVITQTASVTVAAAPTGEITHTLLAAGNNATNTTTYTTQAISPAPNALLTLAVLGNRGGKYFAAPPPTITGGGVTAWVQVATVGFDDSASQSRRRLTVYRAMSATPGSGPITITFSNGQSNAQWVVSQWDGVETSGTNGSGAIGQVGSNAAQMSNGLSLTLSAFSNAANVAYGAFSAMTSVPAITPGSGFTEIIEVSSEEAQPGSVMTERALNRSIIDALWANMHGAGVGVEIRAKTGP